MGYLVICPTCGGKMSVNAGTCPHCGETAFYIRSDRKVAAEEPCDYGSGSKWERCSGRGWYYGRWAWISLCSYGFEGEPAERILLKDGYRYRFARELLQQPGVAEALRNCDYAVEATGRAGDPTVTFYYQRVVCPACKGRGKVRVERTECGWEDIRRRAL